LGGAEWDLARQLGPGLLHFELVTDEWVQAHPLHKGLKGPFKCAAPKNRVEYLSVVAALWHESHRWLDNRPDADSFAGRVESMFWDRIQNGSGASVEDFQSGVCKGRFGGDLCLHLHLWRYALSFDVRSSVAKRLTTQSKKSGFQPGQDKLEMFLKSDSVLALRLTPAVFSAWRARKGRADYREAVFHRQGPAASKSSEVSSKEISEVGVLDMDLIA
jgi:hypothetical protein